MRAIAMLPALTGNIRRPGSGFLYLNGSDSRGIDSDWLAGAELARPARRLRSARWIWPSVLADPGQSSALVCWNINPVASSPEQAALRAALARDDLLTVVCDLFLTDTAAYADYVLPAAGFLECDDIVASYFHHTLSAQVKAAEPPGEALRNAEIFRRLAAEMGFDEPALQEGDEALIEQLLGPSGVSWDELARAGTVRLYPEPRVQFADGFPTPSGRIEIASAAAEADGHPRLPEPSADEPPPPGWLRLLSPGLAVAHERDLRQRPQAAPAHRAGDGRPAPARGGGPRPAQRRSRHAAQRDGRAADGRRDQRCRAAGRRVRAQGPLAVARAGGRERQRAQSRAARPTSARAPRCTACSSSSCPGSIGAMRASRDFLESLDLPPGDLHDAARLAEALRRRCALPRRDPELRGAALPRGAARDRRAPRRARAPRLAGLRRVHADRRRARRDGCDGARGERRDQPLRAPERRLGHLGAWRAARRAARWPRPRAGRSRSCRGSPMRAERPRPACAAC